MHVNKSVDQLSLQPELIKINITNVTSNATKMQGLNFIKIVNGTKFQTMVFLR